MDIKSNYEVVAPRVNTLPPEKLDLVVSYSEALGFIKLSDVRNALASLIAVGENVKKENIPSRVDELLKLTDSELDKRYKMLIQNSVELAKGPYSLKYYQYCSDDVLVIVYSKKDNKSTTEKILHTNIKLDKLSFEEKLHQIVEEKKKGWQLLSDLLTLVVKAESSN